MENVASKLTLIKAFQIRINTDLILSIFLWIQIKPSCFKVFKIHKYICESAWRSALNVLDFPIDVPLIVVFSV